jgi:glycosyltransferase involved in cell wall biosynthesis
MTSRRYRVALLAPLVSPIREPFLGGAQAMLRDLAVTLATRGHLVTLYAAPGSDPTALPGVRLVPVDVDAAALRPADLSIERSTISPQPDAAMQSAFDRAYQAIVADRDNLDLIHAHAYDLAAFAIGGAQPLPIAHTLHMPDIHGNISAALASLAPAGEARAPGQPWLATVSIWCAETYAATCRIDAVIANGVDLDAIPFATQPASPPYLLYAGRIAPEKGAADAIAIARVAGMRLLLAGGVYDQAYFEREVAPWLRAESDVVEYLGSLSHKRVWSLMSGATAVLVPSRWEEPFGLTACEAQASGTPVVGYVRGGLRDIVADGVTGALVAPGDIAKAAAAVAKAPHFDRSACRHRVMRHFTLDAMADGYEALYARMLSA